MELSVTSPRPLAEFARLLELRCGQPVTYEDVPYWHSDDIVRDEGNRLIPRGGTLSIHYKSTHHIRQVIDNALKTYLRAGYPGRFGLDECAGFFHIAPRAFRSAQGVVKERSPLLSTQLSIPSPAATGLELVEDIIRAVGMATGESIAIGVVPTNALMQHACRFGALKGSAQSLLVDVIRQMEMNLSWQLLVGPGGTRFILNIHQLRKCPEKGVPKHLAGDTPLAEESSIGD